MAWQLPILARLDPRPVALACFCFGLFTWRADALGVACYLAFFALLCLLAPRRPGAGPAFLRHGVLFVGGWTAIKLALLSWDAGWTVTPAHLAEAGELGLRLSTLLAIGAALTALVSAPRLSRAVAWALRPVLGKRAWEPALALALMLHFMPLILHTAQRTRLALRCRQLPVSRRRRALLFLQTLLRSLSQLPWTQTLALAARELDGPAAWSWRPEPGMRVRASWLAALAITAAGAWLGLFAQ